MVKNYIELNKNEKFENKIMITCDFHNAKYEFEKWKIIDLDKVNVSFIEPHRFHIKLNGKKIIVLYFDEKNMFLYNREMPIKMKELELILTAVNDGVA